MDGARLAPAADLSLLLGDPNALAGISALPERGTAGIGSLLGEHDAMARYAADLLARRAAGVETNSQPRGEWPTLQSLVPPAVRDRLPSPELVARMVLGSLPGSGDVMAAQDAVNAGRAGISALLGGDYWTAGARGIDATSATLGMLPFVPYIAGMAKGPTTFTIRDRIAKNAADLGWHVDRRQASSASGSNYLTLSRPTGASDSFGDPVMSTVKVRVSDHDLPPSYKGMMGAADFDVGVGGVRGDAQGDWADAVKWLADRAGVSPPASVRAAITKREADAARGAQVEAANLARTRAIQQAAADLDARVMQAFPTEWAAADAKSGDARREAKRALRRRFEAAPRAE